MSRRFTAPSVNRAGGAANTGDHFRCACCGSQQHYINAEEGDSRRLQPCPLGCDWTGLQTMACTKGPNPPHAGYKRPQEEGH